VIRDGCGTLRGALAHVAAGEKQCGWCARAEAFAALEAEAMTPAPRAVPGPVTAVEAALNAAVLAAETAAWEHGNPSSGDRHRDAPLRVIPGGAAGQQNIGAGKRRKGKTA
jgi:hypothetical protein